MAVMDFKRGGGYYDWLEDERELNRRDPDPEPTFAARPPEPAPRPEAVANPFEDEKRDDRERDRVQLPYPSSNDSGRSVAYMRAPEQDGENDTRPPAPPSPPPPVPSPYSESGKDRPGPKPHGYNPGDINTGNPYVDNMINRDRASWEARVRHYAAAKGVAYDPTMIADVIRQVSYAQNAGKDPDVFLRAAEQTIDQRARPTASAGGRGGDADVNGDGILDAGWVRLPNGQVVRSATTTATANPTGGPGGGGGGGATAGASGGTAGGGARGPAFSNTSPLFDDPASRLVEDYALDQFGRRINPDPKSGTALFEQYARELIETLRQPVYSPQDEAIIKTRATDAIEQERTATKQRWLEELSRRGIPPSSGIALDGLLRIDNHFSGLRTTVERDFAAEAIARTRQQRVDVVDTAGRLSEAEEGRLREAGTYARVPFDLQDRAFQRNLQLVGAGGSPADLTGTALGIGGFVRDNARLRESSAMDRARLALERARLGSDRELTLAGLAQQDELFRSGNRSAMTAAMLQYLGYLFG